MGVDSKVVPAETLVTCFNGSGLDSIAVISLSSLRGFVVFIMKVL